MTSPAGARIRARLFDADRPDERLESEQAFATRPSRRQVLWIDLDADLEREDVSRLAPLLELQPRTIAQLTRSPAGPHLSVHGGYLHIRVAAEPTEDDAEPATWLDIIAGRNVVITRHDRPLQFLKDVDKRIERDATAGILSAAAFLAILVEAVLASYHAAVDAIEEDVDQLDAMSLRGNAPHGALGELVRCRRRIARLRRLLADHRSVFTALGSPELRTALDEPEEVALLAGLSARYDGALSAVEESREALLGSFDVYMSRTAQRTNEVMKVLTLTTVLLLPGTLLAGLLGMNVVVPLNKDDPASFWLVVGAITVLAVAIVAVARSRRWL